MTQAPANASPFHPGELAVQKRANSPEAIHRWAARALRDYMDEEHRLFFSQLPMLVAGGRDEQGRPWASALGGHPGFAHAVDEHHLQIDARLSNDDALFGRFNAGEKIGILGIEFHSRRRNRLNGSVVEGAEEKLLVQVEQSYGNCPKYITPRAWCPSSRAGEEIELVTGDSLNQTQQEWLRAADTFFIASGHQAEDATLANGMDVSHRGGAPGFVHVVDAGRLIIPDYSGNNLYNTLGNLHAQPQAGLLFLDFATGAFLQMTGRATIDWNEPNQRLYPAAKRLLHFELDEFRVFQGGLGLQFATLKSA